MTRRRVVNEEGRKDVNGGSPRLHPNSSSQWRSSGKLCLLFALFTGLYFLVNLEESTWLKSTKTSVPKKIPEARLNDKEPNQFILKPKEEFTPAIAWLMSFPNSGTSYTMTMVARSSMKAFATNYCDEVMAPDDEASLSIYPRRHEGPFWAGLSGKIATARDLPDRYVMTKTHCGSRCLKCGPDEYIETPAHFLTRCASGHARIPPKRRSVDVTYPPSRVGKAIHLIRNPMHNVIARYHLERRHNGYSNHTEWLEHHPNDAEGLQQYCKDMDATYKKQDEKFFGKDKIPKAPCHGEFYKWTQWHNMVHESLKLIDSLHQVPVLTVHYEDYNTKFNETAAGILEFLELEQVAELRPFTSRSDYDPYFSDAQKKDIRDLVKRVASAKTWSQVKHYFD